MSLFCNPLAVAWKHNHAPGIRCSQVSETDPRMVLVAWPESLGAEPTQEDLDQWEAEYTADRESKAYIPSRADAYEAAILNAKGFVGGDKVTGLGFVLDAVIAELRARGSSVTDEFAAVCDIIDAVKAAHPKPQ